jgi:uncharacterized protein YkwD
MARSAAAFLGFVLAASPDAATLAEPVAYASELVSLVNRYRAGAHVAPLVPDPALSALARQHSEAMMRAHRLSHEDFPARVRRSGYSMCVENVGWNYPTPSDQMKAWRASPGHDRNLLDPRVTHAGVGVSGDYIAFIACR